MHGGLRTRGVRAALLGVGAVAALLLAMPQAALSAPSPAAAVAPAGHATGFVRGGAAVAPNVDGLHRSASGGVRALAAGLPASVSLERYAVAVGNQGDLGACTTWAIGYAMAGWYSMRTGDGTTFAPMYLYSQDRATGGGSSSEDAYEILSTQGIAPQLRYSHGDSDEKHKPSAADRAAAAAYRTTAPHYLFNLFGTTGSGAAGRLAIETAIAAQHPVAIAIPTSVRFASLDAKHAVYRQSQAPKHGPDWADHMLLVVGYDATGVRVQNSWGTAWGDQGFATLDWSFVEHQVQQASWIQGFAKTVPATAPAQVDEFSARYTSYADSGDLTARWRGTGAFDDSARHPVTAYDATLTGSNGSVRTTTVPVAEDGWSSSASFDVTDMTIGYTLTVAARNAVGTGPAQTFAFTPNGLGWGQEVESGTLAGADLPSPAMPAPHAPPVTRPSATRATFADVSPDRIVIPLKAPRFTGNSPLASYRVTVTGKKGTKVVYRRVFTVPGKQRSLVLRTGAGKGRRIPGRLSGYGVAIVVKNRAGRTSAPIATMSTVRWSAYGWSCTGRVL